MFRPSKENFIRLAHPGHVVAVVQEIDADRLTPVDAFYALNASFLLESAERGTAVGRYSFLGVEPETRLTIDGQTVTVDDRGVKRVIESADPLRVLGDFLSSQPFSGEGELTPFPGGAVGYAGYDIVRRYEKLGDGPAPDPSTVPDALFMITRFIVAFDNLMHTVKVICNVRCGEDPRADYAEAIGAIEAITGKLRNPPPLPPQTVKVGKPESVTGKERFEQSVEEVKEMIAAGEAIQIVLSQRLTADFDGDPFGVFRALRRINPSPYMFYIDFGEFQLLGTSPEVMVRVDDGKAMVRPIAGTRPRGATPEADAALKAELLEDEKERAEHIMLIDLARNDLGKIALPGTVKVDRMMDVERYSHVMHIVSEVSAQLGSEVDIFDVIRAVFPAGTVSGAPKVRAMEIIDEKEPVRRSWYAGLVGYFSRKGDFDSCITIRTALVRDQKIHLQAGAGIVYDSRPEKEYQETVNKASALIAALDVAEGRS